MRLRVLGVLVLILVVGDGTVNLARCNAALKVGILPFRVYSAEKVSYLQDEVAERLAEQLARNKEIVLVDQQTLRSALPGLAEGREWNKDSLARAARTAGADFLIYGSLTKIENAISIDSSVITTMPDTGTFRSFVEGRDLELLIKQMEGKITQHLLSAGASKLAPPAEKVEAKASPIKETPISAAEGQPSDSGSAASSSPPQPETQAGPEAGAQAVSPSAEEEAPEAEEAEEVPQSETPALEPGPPAALPESALPVNVPDGSSASAPAATKPAMEASLSRLPIRISSESMVADNPQRTVTFFGSVKAVKDDMVIHSAQMTTFYSEGQEVEKITAQGNVKISQKDLAASCEMATFLQGAQKIILTGKPKVWQGNNMVSGEKITILLDQDKILIEGGKKKQERVNVVIYPKEKKE